MQGVLIAAQVGSIKTLVDGSVSITFNTQEVSPGKAAELFALRKMLAYLYVSAQQINTTDQKLIDGMKPEYSERTPGQRLRGVLYRMWEQDNEGYKDSNSHYIAKMELIIETYKANLI
jgi:hypothetical protein